MPTTAGDLNLRLHQSIGDSIRTVVTANIAANTTVNSSHLLQYDGGRDGTFVDWWLYIESKNNAEVDRKVRNYWTANSTCKVYGANLSSDTNVADIRLSRYSYTDAQVALNDAIRETYPSLHRPVQDTSIVCNSYFYEYALPTNFQTGTLYEVQANTSSGPIGEVDWDTIHNWEIVNEGRTIQLQAYPANNQILRLLGTIPLETVSAIANTVTIDDPHTNALLAYARYKFYQQLQGVASSEDKIRFETESAKAYGEYRRLIAKNRITTPRRRLKLGS